MKIVLDTNVVVSRILNPHGPPARIFDYWEAGTFNVLVSTNILKEYARVLRYDRLRKLHKQSEEGIDAIIAGFSRFAELVEPSDSLHVVTDDPGDDIFLECAVQGGAEYIVSGDAHLLSVQSYNDIQIVTPAVFLAFLQGNA